MIQIKKVIKVRILFILIFLNLTGIHSIFSQTIISGVVTDSIGKPIPYANVYLSKTTYGTLTDINGKYSLKINKEGYYQVIASCVGYNSDERNIYTDGKEYNINYKLSTQYIKLNEVTIKAGEKLKRKYYKLFIKQFIGETTNSYHCKIQNIEELQLYLESNTDNLKGFTVKPLKIENEALGYTIFYELKDFSYNLKSQKLQYSGYYYFKSHASTERNEIKWQQKRLLTYEGSRMHFIRSLFADSLSRENFEIFESSNINDTKSNDSVEPIPISAIITQNNLYSKRLFSKKPISIIYKEQSTTYNSKSNFDYQIQNHKTTLFFSDTVLIFQNGFFEKPYSLNWAGAMTLERVADLLPFDYQPQKSIIVSQIAKENPEQKPIQMDQVFVQTDRNIYRPGDSIFFQSYIRDKNTEELKSNSKALYVLLFNSQREMVDSSRFRINEFVAPGWMAIPEDAKPGKYRFVAFTSNMQNYNPKDAFSLDLEVKSRNDLPLITEISYNKQNYLPGDTVVVTFKIMDNKKSLIVKQKFNCSLISGKNEIKSNHSKTNQDGTSVLEFVLPDTILSSPRFKVSINRNYEQISDFNIPFKSQFISFNFLPEGGTLIKGIEQRIGFNATNSIGETIKIEGLLKNVNGKILDTIKSGKYGPGSFTCKSEEGMYVELTNNNFDKKIWPLDNIQKNGFSLNIRPLDDQSFFIQVQSDKYTGEKVFLKGMMDKDEVFTQELILDKIKRIVFDTKGIKPGMAQIILLNSQNIPVVERLIFINHKERINFTIAADSATYKPGQETELTITANDNDGNPVTGIFSISAVDSLSGINPELYIPGIEYTYKYHPYFLKNLPVAVLKEGLENIKNEELDLLTMVYGWSRYSYGNDSITNEINDYDRLKIEILYVLKSYRNNRNLVLLQFPCLSKKYLQTNENGEILLPLDSLDKNALEVILMPDSKQNKMVRFAGLSIPENQAYFKSTSFFSELPFMHLADANKTEFDKFDLSDSVYMIPEVTIKKYAKRQEFADITSEDSPYHLGFEKLWGCNTLEIAARKLTGIGFPTNINVDGWLLNNPLLDPHDFSWMELARAIPPTSVAFITFDKGLGIVDGHPVGMLNIITRINLHNPLIEKRFQIWKLKTDPDRMFVPLKIYRQSKEFYNPSKSELAINPFLQERPTIYWNPLVYFDKEPVKIKFPNLKNQGKVKIIINGISSNNLIGTAGTSYTVK
jgi:hypothetical protein